MGQKNKLGSSNKVDNIVLSVLQQYGLRALEDNQEHTELRMVLSNVWRGKVIQNCLDKILFGLEPAARPVHDRKYLYEKTCIVLQF